MKKNYIKFFEEFTNNNISKDDIINCINNKGLIYVNNIKKLPNHKPSEGLIPISIDEDGLVTISIDDDFYEIELNKITKITN